MAIKIFPVEALAFPEDIEIDIKSTIHSFGGLEEQRIVNDLPVGDRESGVGTQKTFIGQRSIFVGIPQLEFRGDPFPGNANLENSVETAWLFFLDLYYDSTDDIIKFEAFYYYDPIVNDNRLTWTGDTSSGPLLNTRGESVTNVSGRYLVRFAESKWRRSHFIRCLTSFSLELIEVAA